MRLLDGEVIDHRDGRGAHTDKIVHVHRDAIYPYGVIPVRKLSYQDFRPNAVGGDGKAEVVADLDDVGKVSDAEPLGGAEPADGVDGLKEVLQ